METHGSKHTAQKHIRTDKGSELWRSHAFQQMMRDAWYILEPTEQTWALKTGYGHLFMQCILKTAYLIVERGWHFSKHAPEVDQLQNHFESSAAQL